MLLGFVFFSGYSSSIAGTTMFYTLILLPLYQIFAKSKVERNQATLLVFVEFRTIIEFLQYQLLKLFLEINISMSLLIFLVIVKIW